MANGDLLLRAFANLTSLRASLPEGHMVEEKWVQQYNSTIERLSATLGRDLSEFQVPPGELRRAVENHNILSGRTTYTQDLWCERAVLMQKLDAVLTYFNGLQKGQDRSVGFDPP